MPIPPRCDSSKAGACIEYGSDPMTEVRRSFSLRDSISVPRRNPINRIPKSLEIVRFGVFCSTKKLQYRLLTQKLSPTRLKRSGIWRAFVEVGLFRGTCYRAANWRYVGQTRGRGR